MRPRSQQRRRSCADACTRITLQTLRKRTQTRSRSESWGQHLGFMAFWAATRALRLQTPQRVNSTPGSTLHPCKRRRGQTLGEDSLARGCSNAYQRANARRSVAHITGGMHQRSQQPLHATKLFRHTAAAAAVCAPQTHLPCSSSSRTGRLLDSAQNACAKTATNTGRLGAGSSRPPLAQAYLVSGPLRPPRAV
jgi:hypothetical protein